MNLLQVINNVVPSIVVSDREVEFEYQTTSSHLLNLLDILKNHSLTQMKSLVEITIIDISINALQFYVTYFLLSTHYNARVRISVQTNDMFPIISITIIFNSIN